MNYKDLIELQKYYEYYQNLDNLIGYFKRQTPGYPTVEINDFRCYKPSNSNLERFLEAEIDRCIAIFKKYDFDYKEPKGFPPPTGFR